MTQTVADLRSYLAGSWAFLRLLDDRLLGQPGSIVGQAAFDPDGAGLVYRERGMLRFAGGRGAATRCYRYSFSGPQRAEVAFEDGRPFHPLCLSTGHCLVEHLCGEDRYAGSFEARGPNALRVCWRVKGPRKDYRLATDYLRFAATTGCRQGATAHAA